VVCGFVLEEGGAGGFGEKVVRSYEGVDSYHSGVVVEER